MERLSWDDLRILLAVHRSGSLLGAGRRLGLSTSTTGRRLDSLEAALGKPLVQRSQSGTALTPFALRLVVLAEDLERGLDTERREGGPNGVLKVSVPDGLAYGAAQALLSLHAAFPEIDLELWGDNRLADIARREADIGLRLRRSTSSVLVEKHVATLRFALYASEDYVRRLLPARRLTPGTAAQHLFVGLDRQWKDLPHERWMVALGARRFVLRSTAMAAILEAVRAGAGIAALVEQDARNAGLVRIDVDVPGPVQELFVVYHHDLRKVAHVRAAVAALAAWFGAHA